MAHRFMKVRSITLEVLSESVDAMQQMLVLVRA
jgi:hypothetical protein